MHDEDGSVLIAVVGIMVVLTVLAIGAFAMADDNLFQVKRDRGRTQALAVAEGGLEQVLWRLKAGRPPTSTAPFDVVLPGMGVASIEASQSGTNWHIVATGNASATPGITRTISVDVLSMSIWDMFYANGPVSPGSNGHINGSGSFWGSAYMRGNWPPSNGNAAFEQGPFFVKDGNIALGGSATIGMSTPVPPGVDIYCNGSVNMTGISPNAKLHASVPDLPMPQQSGPELTVARNIALGESTDGLQGTPLMGGLRNDEIRTSGDGTGVPSPLGPPFADKLYPSFSSRYYKVIDNDSIVNTSVAAFYIGKSSAGVTLPSFGQPYDPALGHSPDDFAWDAATGVLTVQGTVFIDAQDVYIKDVKWAGKGTLIIGGNVHVTGLWEPACFTVAPIVTKDPSDVDGYPKKNCVGISSSGYIEMFSPDGYGPSFSAVSWTMNPSGNYEMFHGEIVAPEITMGKHAQVWCTPGMSSSMPPSMPGGSGMIVAISGWHEGRN
jgi:hypothetical protein